MLGFKTTQCFLKFSFTEALCLQEMRPCIDQTRNRNPVSILMFVALESVHLPVFCRHWSEKTLGNRPFYRGLFARVLQNPHRDKKRKFKSQRQKMKNGNPEGDLQVRWKVLAEISMFLFFVPVQALYLPPFFVPVHVLELQDAETRTGTKKMEAQAPKP